MPRVAKALSALEVKRLDRQGWHAVGTVPSLGLLITPEGTKSWVLRATYGGKRRPIGLGGYPAVTLSQAIERARQLKLDIENGIDPIQAKKANKSKLLEEQAKAKTFKQCAELFIPSRKFTNAKHAKQWVTTLETYVYPHIGDIYVRDLSVAHIKEVLDPIWLKIPETAKRIQNRIEQIINYAIVSEYRVNPNPARWNGYLDMTYQLPKEVKPVVHQPSMPYSKVNEFLVALRKHKALSARLLEFLILTVVRSEAARQATWSQIDLKKGTWTVPTEFTKTKKRPHLVPLSKQAIELLKDMPRFEGIDLVFPSSTFKTMSDSTISKLMREMRNNKEFDCEGVPHGFRATFQVYRLEATNYSMELGELTLGHSVSDAVYDAYQRSDGYVKRIGIMQDWADFVNKKYKEQRGNNVIDLKKARA